MDTGTAEPYIDSARAGTFTGSQHNCVETLKTTELAPIPRARVTIAVRAKPGDFAVAGLRVSDRST